MHIARRSGPRRSGFTILEVVLVGFLTALLAGLLVQTWVAYDRAATEVAARCELVQEADFAVSMLANDLGGTDSTLGPLVGLRFSSTSGGQIQLCYDGGSSPNGLADWDASPGPDVIVTYALSNPGTPGPLVRQVSTSGDSQIVAYHILTLQVRTLPKPYIQIDLTLRHPLLNLIQKPTPGPLERTFTLIATQP